MGIICNGNNLQTLFYHVATDCVFIEELTVVQKTGRACLSCGSFSLIQTESLQIGKDLGILPLVVIRSQHLSIRSFVVTILFVVKRSPVLRVWEWIFSLFLRL